MRGGRNKFGPMYKRDRARKLQLLRQRQLAAQQARSQGLIVSDVVPLTYGSGNSGYLNQGIASIKQEIQIPQVSSLTSSPDSSPSPLASLGMVNGGGGGGNGPGGQNGGNISLPDPSKLWGATSSTSPNSSSNNQKSNQFAYDSTSNNQAGGNNGGQGDMGGGNRSQSGGSSSQVKSLAKKICITLPLLFLFCTLSFFPIEKYSSHSFYFIFFFKFSYIFRTLRIIV